jgi:hypothetical protein
MLHHVALVRTDVSEEHRFSEEPHGVTYQNMAVFISLRLENLKSYIVLTGWAL